MTLPIAFPIRLGAPLSRVDPRWKLAALGIAGLAAGALRTPAAVALAFVGSLMIVALARVPVHWYLTRIATLVLFLSMFLIALPFLDHGDEARWQIGPLSLSPRGFLLAGVLLMKALTLMSLLL